MRSCAKHQQQVTKAAKKNAVKQGLEKLLSKSKLLKKAKAAYKALAAAKKAEGAGTEAKAQEQKKLAEGADAEAKAEEQKKLAEASAGGQKAKQGEMPGLKSDELKDKLGEKDGMKPNEKAEEKPNENAADQKSAGLKPGDTVRVTRESLTHKLRFGHRGVLESITEDIGSVMFEKSLAAVQVPLSLLDECSGFKNATPLQTLQRMSQEAKRDLLRAYGIQNPNAQNVEIVGLRQDELFDTQVGMSLN